MNFLLLNLLLLTGKISFGGGDILIITSSSDRITYAFDNALNIKHKLGQIKEYLDTLTGELKLEHLDEGDVKICDTKNVKGDEEFAEHINDVNDSGLIYIAAKIDDCDEWYFGYTTEPTYYKTFEEKFFGAFACFDIEIENSKKVKCIKDIERKGDKQYKDVIYIDMSEYLIQDRLLVSGSLAEYDDDVGAGAGGGKIIISRDKNACYTVTDIGYDSIDSIFQNFTQTTLLPYKKINNDDDNSADENSQQILEDNISVFDDEKSQNSFYNKMHDNICDKIKDNSQIKKIVNSNSENDLQMPHADDVTKSNNADQSYKNNAILGPENVLDNVKNAQLNHNSVYQTGHEIHNHRFQFQRNNLNSFSNKQLNGDNAYQSSFRRNHLLDKKDKEEIENNSGGSTKNKLQLLETLLFFLLAIVLIIVLVFFIKLCIKLIILIKIAIMKYIKKFSKQS